MILETISKGSTYQGCELEFFETVEGVDVPMILTTATIKLDIQDKYGKVMLSMTTPTGLTVNENVVTIPAQIINLKEGDYKFDLKVNFSDTEIMTGLASGTWKITKPITI